MTSGESLSPPGTSLSVKQHAETWSRRPWCSQARGSGGRQCFGIPRGLGAHKGKDSHQHTQSTCGQQHCVSTGHLRTCLVLPRTPHEPNTSCTPRVPANPCVGGVRLTSQPHFTGEKVAGREDKACACTGERRGHMAEAGPGLPQRPPTRPARPGRPEREPGYWARGPPSREEPPLSSSRCWERP